MNVKFWGTRGTFPKINSNGGSNISNHTSCVQIFDNDKSLYIDSGTGFEAAARSHFAQHPSEPMNLLLTHFHWDHLLGLFSVYDLFVKGLRIHLCSGDVELSQKTLKLFEHTYCPLKPEIIRGVFCFEVLDAHAKLNDWEIESIPVPHSGTTFAYGVKLAKKSVVYVPDIELEKVNISSFGPFQGCDLVICDSFHTDADKKVYGSLSHSSEIEAVEFAAKLGAKNLALFHYAPIYNDQDIQQMFKHAQERAKKHNLKICFSSDELVVTL